MKNDEISWFFLGALLGFCTAILFGVAPLVMSRNQRLSGEQFISGNATYICTKTNELKEGGK